MSDRFVAICGICGEKIPYYKDDLNLLGEHLAKNHASAGAVNFIVKGDSLFSRVSKCKSLSLENSTDGVLVNGRKQRGTWLKKSSKFVKVYPVFSTFLSLD